MRRILLTGIAIILVSLLIRIPLRATRKPFIPNPPSQMTNLDLLQTKIEGEFPFSGPLGRVIYSVLFSLAETVRDLDLSKPVKGWLLSYLIQPGMSRDQMFEILNFPQSGRRYFPSIGGVCKSHYLDDYQLRIHTRDWGSYVTRVEWIP